jgi:NAD(P)H-hydrate epimerase
VVLDADGLNIAAEHQLLTAHDKASRLVLTPHPGEFARLSGLSISDINSRREQVAVNFAKQCQAVVVLKGAGTVVTDGEQVFTNTTGNPGMATGGTGDVLTGLLAAQLAQGLSPFDAACLAVHVHGLAGDLAAEQLSQRGMIASDLLTFLPQAWKQLE